MKEIKAYIRLKRAEDVIHALEDAGVPGLTVVEVKGIGKAAVPEKERFSIEYAEKYSTITKVEVICSDVDADRIVEIIREAAYTGNRGDGMIFVSEVVGAVKIRTGEAGEGALASSG